ncbi:hypothetical protein INR49_020045, partial [Caranx melampygus]
MSYAYRQEARWTHRAVIEIARLPFGFRDVYGLPALICFIQLVDYQGDDMSHTAVHGGLRVPARSYSRFSCKNYKVIYTDWANHYLAKSGHKRLIKDLQTDVTDGVLLAEIIQVVANEKIDDINGCPKSRSQMIENIDACLSFLAAKGVNIQGLSAEERTPPPEPAEQCPGPAQPLSAWDSCPHSPESSTGRDAVQSKLLKFSLGQKKTSRLPGPTARVSTAGGDIPPRGSVSAAGNRRSQGFSDKTKANSHLNKDSSEGTTSQPSVMTEHAPSSAVTVSSSTSIPAATSALIPPSSSSSPPPSSSTAIPQPNGNSKPWRSKSMSSKHATSPSPSSTSTPSSAMQSVKQEKDASSKAAPATEAPSKAVTQKSMLEKLKLFNSKGGSKSSTSSSSSSSNGVVTQNDNGAPTRHPGTGQVEKTETGSNTDFLEEDDGNVRPGMNGTSNGTASGAAPSAAITVSTTASSPKIALRGIAQRTFSRALTAKKGSVKGPEKDKDKDKDKESRKEKEKDKGKEVGKRVSVPDRTELRGEEPKEEVSPVAVDTDSSNKRTSKIASFIPKGGKVAKKESSTPAHSGIPKPGGKAQGVGGKASS